MDMGVAESAYLIKLKSDHFGIEMRSSRGILPEDGN